MPIHYSQVEVAYDEDTQKIDMTIHCDQCGVTKLPTIPVEHVGTMARVLSSLMEQLGEVTSGTTENHGMSDKAPDAAERAERARRFEGFKERRRLARQADRN